MASFITQLTTIAFNPDFTETPGVYELPVFAPSFDVFKVETITDPGLKGKARNDADIKGAQWVEGTFYFDACAFTAYDSKWEPPYWGVFLQSAAMKRTGNEDSPSWIYEVVDTIHLSTDTVHTGEHLIALDASLNIDGNYNTFANAISDITISVNVDDGPPRITVNSFMGNIYNDDESPDNFDYPFPTTDVPDAFGPILTTFEEPSKVDSKALTLSLSVLTQEGDTEIITGICFRSWAHTLGNNIVEQRCGTETFKLDQFILGDQNANTATLIIKAPDPGTFASPSTFNPEEMIQSGGRGGMIRFALTYNEGITLGEILFECDYYIQTVSKAPDSGGVLEYTLTLQQANLIPAGTAAQYLKVTCT